MSLMQSACVTHTQRVSVNSLAKSSAELNHWQAIGRIGITSTEQSGSGGFTWQQDGTLSQVSLRGPVGVGSLSVSLDGAAMALQSSDGTYYDAELAMQHMEQKLGVALPIEQLRYWLVGSVAPSSYHWLDTKHDLLEQSGWLIKYQEWTGQDELRLPKKLSIERDAVRILVVIQSWNVS